MCSSWHVCNTWGWRSAPALAQVKAGKSRAGSETKRELNGTLFPKKVSSREVTIIGFYISPLILHGTNVGHAKGTRSSLFTWNVSFLNIVNEVWKAEERPF